MSAPEATRRRIRDAGDSALVLELEPRIDAALNARAIAIADAVRSAHLPGIRDVVSTYRSVAVFYDPLRTRIEPVIATLESAFDTPAPEREQSPIDVPVAYGGEHGPDLAEVARWAGLPESEVIRRHSSALYRVFMLGFVPGFAYMGTVDPSIAAPRHSTPRVRVPAGSVGIAAAQTGIYPQETPGGWQVIGRTGVKPFDPSRTPAVLFAPGDSVRFTPVTRIDVADRVDASGAAREDAHGARTVTVLRPGLLTTVQDTGRWGQQDRGVPVAGPMDSVAHRVANILVGNPPDAATLEVTLLGPELRFEDDAVIAITGADLSARLDDRPMVPPGARQARAGSLLRFGERLSGARAYIAFDGGIDVPAVLGSRATHVLTRMGGISGRPLAAGDRLRLGPNRDAPVARVLPVEPLPERGARLRVLPGPQSDFFDGAAFNLLQRRRFIISPQSNRMAYRLTGGAIPRAPGREMISDATFVGGIQVPPSGDPILLMADRQTSGGYPQIATVISADLPIAGQLAPGDWITFRVCTRREAFAALISQEGQLLGIR